MLIEGFPAGPWGTNCFVVAAAAGSECLIVDPGMDAMAGVQAIIAKHRLHPAAVLLTHGHLDHTWSVIPVCSETGVPAYIHSRDRGMLADPAAGMSREMMTAVQQLTGGALEFAEPDDVVELADNDRVELLGVPLTVRHTPGHTPGSVVFSLAADSAMPPVLFSGDLLFAGSIGRTDLPGGDSATMMRSLQNVLPAFADDTVVLPGHGPQTTMAAERRTNPFLTGQATL